MPNLETELLVLGGGPGGYSAAFRAADLGLSVTLLERYGILGGTCLNVGCIPSKTLLHFAQIIDSAAALNQIGINFSAPQITIDQVRAAKDTVIAKLTKGLATLAKQRKVRIVTGVGRFRDPNCIEIINAESQINFQHAIIATGSHSVSLSGLPADPRIINSTAALALSELPRHLLIIGGGVIGLEMAGIYSAFGTRVTIVELTPSLIPGCDPDLVRILQRRIATRNAIHLNTKITKVNAQETTLIAHLSGPGGNFSLDCDRILIAVGRRPNSADLGLEMIGVKCDANNFIAIDPNLRTTVPHIYAIGDVVGNPQLAHKAAAQGKRAAEIIAGHHPPATGIIPSVAYTDPEIAWVGMSEDMAKQQGIPYAKGQFPWGASGRVLSLGRTDGLTKLIFDPVTTRLIGAGIVGPGAGELIAETALAITIGATASDLARTIHPHPSLSETISCAAEVFQGTITDLYLAKGR